MPKDAILRVRKIVNGNAEIFSTLGRFLPLMNAKKPCKCIDNHPIHVCQLKIIGAQDLLEILTNNPIVKCENCGAEANTGSYVCWPDEN